MGEPALDPVAAGARELFLTEPQGAFVMSEADHPCLCGGYGSGKSHAGIMRAMAKKLAYPDNDVGYYLPTFDLVKRAALPRFAQAAEMLGVEIDVHKSDSTLAFGAGGEYGQIILRTMDTPHRIVAYETSDSVIDELDTLPREQAEDVWNKIIARNRQNKPDGSANTAAVTTTPEGFRFVHERWGDCAGYGVPRGRKGEYELIKAPTASNPFVKQAYIDKLREQYSPKQLEAYLMGEFVNMTSGSVYADYDRRLNHCDTRIESNEPLHVGMDFNVGRMAAVVAVTRRGDPHFVGEHTGLFDTPAMIARLKAAYPGHAILVYPDASGASRRSNNASASDISLLRTAGFVVCVNTTNPAVKDRVLCMNAMLRHRRMRVNADLCPVLCESLEKQAYDKNGEPDKKSGWDHAVDAAGYFIVYRFPLQSRMVQFARILGV